jgi:hypothetical protein
MGGLSEEILRQAIRAGDWARATTSTGNYPRCYSGLSSWAEIVKKLRDLLLAKGWHKTLHAGLEGVMSPEGSVEILVETGDERTGDETSIIGPTTKYPKGDGIAEAIDNNYLLEFGNTEIKRNEEIRNQEFHSAEGMSHTWFLLHHTAPNGEIRIELSRPLTIAGGFVNEWAERIILSPIPPAGSTLVVPEDNPVNPEIDVRRRESK